MNSFKQEKKNFHFLWEVIRLGQFTRNVYSPSTPTSGFHRGILVTKILTTAFQKLKSNPVPIISY